MIEEKIARVKVLIQKREEIDAELAAMFGGADVPRRGRPRKEAAGHADGSSVSIGVSRSVSATSAESKSSTPPEGN